MLISIILLISDFEKVPDPVILKEFSIKHEIFAFGVFHSRLKSFPAFPFVEMQAVENNKPFTISTDTALFYSKQKEEASRILQVEKI